VVLVRWQLFLLLLLICPTGFAKKLYKYQDHEGRWYFTDQPPETEHPVTVRQLKPAAKQRVSLEKIDSSREPGFCIINDYPGPIEVAIDWQTRSNVTAKPALPKRFVVEPGKSASLFKVNADGQTGARKFTLSYRYVIGRPLVDYISTEPYQPPLAPGARFQITQAFGGQYSHQDAQNHYAVDIMMPEGTPVHAARAGTVLEVENDFFKSGQQQAYADKANSIRILHDDGSMAVYAHLALEQARVQPGSKVRAGDLIGFSGNTGFTSGPHLHFAVQINQGMELVSVPFQFLDAKRSPFQPQLGDWLQGFNGAP
jgi:murein DD-endopeptidase MepM/ murein hydrolase activator NlpD